MKSRVIKILTIIALGLCTQLQAKDSDIIYGIDISHHQGDIDWEKVNKWNGNKIHFVYIKATEGSTLIDQHYKKNLEAARDNNFLVGSYHYFKTSSSPESQFDNFKSVAPKSKQQLIPIVDVEERGKQWDEKTFHRNLKSFLDMVERHYGCKPMIYTSNTFYNKYLANKYDDYKIFIGRYSEKQPNLKDEKNWHIWQFSRKGVVSGISHKVDINRIHSEYNLKDIMID